MNLAQLWKGISSALGGRLKAANPTVQRFPSAPQVGRIASVKNLPRPARVHLDIATRD